MNLIFYLCVCVCVVLRVLRIITEFFYSFLDCFGITRRINEFTEKRSEQIGTATRYDYGFLPESMTTTKSFSIVLSIYSIPFKIIPERASWMSKPGRLTDSCSSSVIGCYRLPPGMISNRTEYSVDRTEYTFCGNFVEKTWQIIIKRFPRLVRNPIVTTLLSLS